MPVKFEQKKIQGLEFQLSMLPARAALENFHKTLRVCGPGVVPALRGMAAGKLDKAALFEVGGAIFMALSTAPTADVMQLSESLLQSCRVKTGGKWADLGPVYDEVLQGKLWAQLNLVVWAIQLNFADFFDELKVAGAAPEKDPAPEKK